MYINGIREVIGYKPEEVHTMTIQSAIFMAAMAVGGILVAKKLAKLFFWVLKKALIVLVIAIVIYAISNGGVDQLVNQIQAFTR